MAKYTKLLQFDENTRRFIAERDKECIFCKIGYKMDKADSFGLIIKDIMHYIPKSQMGLGVKENGALGCRYHHQMLDNGNEGVRKEMMVIFRNYLKSVCQGWNEKKIVYRKWDF